MTACVDIGSADIPRTRGFTRTRGSGTGRVDISRVGSGKKITGTGIPVFYP